MTKLSWPKARRYQDAEPTNVFVLRPQYGRNDWINAKKKRQINVLTDRIASGKEWLEQTPSTDPRWTRGHNKLQRLIQERKDLRAAMARNED